MTIHAGITEIVQSIWTTILALPLEEAGPGDSPSEPTVTCFVHLEGAWEGAVVLRCSETLAGRIAAAMIGSTDEPDPAEVSDAIGEITNIIAGHVKALLPHPCHITLPVVALGRDYQLQMLGTQPVAEAAFACEREPFVVTVLRSVAQGS
jgi:chemotaxis protein CheX